MKSSTLNNSMILKNIDLKIRGESILNNISLKLRNNQSLAIIGHSGSGKTILGKIISGRLKASSGELNFSEKLNRLMVDQQDHFLFHSGMSGLHYGQRYESLNSNGGLTVGIFLKNVVSKKNDGEFLIELDQVMLQMEISHLKERELLQLSNGERKRVQLAKALLQKPELLVLDQPFVGLDIHSREALTDLLEKLIKSGIWLILICDQIHIPKFINKVAELDGGKLKQFVERDKYLTGNDFYELSFDQFDKEQVYLLSKTNWDYENIVLMKKVNVILNGNQVLDGIDWNIKKGERWALLGHNGAGKTSLLSLITADNPQGYNNHLILFDQKRGSGESIWDIKKKIGLVSPELHLYLLRGTGIFNTVPGLADENYQAYHGLSCRDVVLSGLKDEVGFISSVTELQIRMAEEWLSILRLAHLSSRLFIHASIGEQRSVLLARALIKSPALLVLDEPCQGLDHMQTTHFTGLLDHICANLELTIIYVTHQQEEIPKCVTHFIELENGKVKECGGIKTV